LPSPGGVGQALPLQASREWGLTMVKVLMPKGSDTMTEGKVLKWVKKEGDQISAGDAVVEIETDKVDMEVEAMGGGVLRKILVQSGKVVPVGELLALIGKPDEDISALLKGEGAAATPAQARDWAVAAGDDYELLFAVPPERFAGLHAAADRLNLTLTAIGELSSGAGVTWSLNGEHFVPSAGGFDHFARASTQITV